jgi:DNA modification methylase
LQVALHRSAIESFSIDSENLFAAMAEGLDTSDWFYESELDELLSDLVAPKKVEDAPPDVSKADELQKKYGTKTNQLWTLGKHKLLIGDCTTADSMALLMGNEKWNAIVTDPPYGVDYVGGRNPDSNTPRAKLKGDGDALLYQDFLNVWMATSDKKGAVYMWYADKKGKAVYDAVESVGLTVRAMIVWNKLDAHYGNFMAQYMQKHEPCLYCVKDSTDWYGPTNEVTVWDIKQPNVNEFHPTEKPLECMERPIRNSTKPGDIVVDPFVGSGTTLMACERMDRQCRAMEINPGFAAVVLERWSTSTGQTPVLINEG